MKTKAVRLDFLSPELASWNWYPVIEGIGPVPERRVFVTSPASNVQRFLTTLAFMQSSGGWRHFDLFTKEEIVCDPILAWRGERADMPDPIYWSYGHHEWFWKPFDDAGLAVQGRTTEEAVAWISTNLKMLCDTIGPRLAQDIAARRSA